MELFLREEQLHVIYSQYLFGTYSNTYELVTRKVANIY